ncbi:MAG: hypothetical protein IKV55_03955, partial [Oscillospiraceae bacterium]|nr:hypothetical protein [Oscillospiraceae bacterium]
MKRILASLLLVIMLFSYSSPIAVLAATPRNADIVASILGTEPACDCGSTAAYAYEHEASCALVQHYQAVAERSTAEEIYALHYYGFGSDQWDRMEIISSWLYDNDMDKYMAVNSLFAEWNEPVLPEKTPQVSVSGLPEGASVSVTEAGFEGALDITVTDAEGNAWQPAAGASVQVTLPVNIEHDGYVDVLHFVEDADKVSYALENGFAFVLYLDDADETVRAALADAVAAYQAATGDTEVAVAVEGFEHVAVKDETVCVEAMGGFSIWYVTAYGTLGPFESDWLGRYDFDDFVSANQPVYVTPGESINISYSGTAPTIVGNGVATGKSNSSILGNYYTVSVSSGAVEGTQFTVTYGNQTVTFEVADDSELDDTPVIIAV